MKKLNFLLLSAFIPVMIPGPLPVNKNMTQDPISQIENIQTLDERGRILQAYLTKYNSPLNNNAQDFVDAADNNNLDWRLVASIAGIESTFGKFIPGGVEPKYTSYNAWGWGVYGTQAIYFKSWKQGIYTVSEGLRKNYVSRGLNDPESMNRMYSASPTWGSRVNYFMNDIQKFDKNYRSQNSLQYSSKLEIQIAGSSAQTNLD